MNIENLTESIQSIIECAKAIEYELENNSGDSEDAKALYETLEGNGVTTDGDEIIAAVELVAELSSEDACEINSALELWECVEGNGHDPDDIEAALEVYATVRRCVGNLTGFSMQDLENLLETSREWNEHCGGIWSTPEAMVVAYEELSKGRTVDTKEQALLDAIKAFCEPA
jgi:hypothetical protein